jgi:hypothetical protein
MTVRVILSLCSRLQARKTALYRLRSRILQTICQIQYFFFSVLKLRSDPIEVLCRTSCRAENGRRRRKRPCFQGSDRRLPIANRSPPKRLAKASASSGLEKQNITNSLSSRRREYVNGVADRTPAAQNITSLFLRPRTLSAGSAVRCGIEYLEEAPPVRKGPCPYFALAKKKSRRPGSEP